MERKIISIREMKARKDPDYFIRTVLNTPEHQASILARREAEWKHKNTAERQMRQADVDMLMAKVAILGVGIGWLAAMVGMM